MRKLGKVMLRGLVVLLPTVLTIYLCWRIAAGTEAFLAGLIPERYYIPGMGLVAAVGLVFLVGLFAQWWVLNAFFRLIEREINRIPLVKTLFGAIKDLMAFFPGQGGQPTMARVVMTEIAGRKVMGMVTREDLSGLPQAMQRKDEVLVYIPMSYQIGGFTLWIPREALTPVEMSIPEAMRFAMTAGMSTTPEGVAAPPVEKT